jgi:hypothetical protein
VIISAIKISEYKETVMKRDSVVVTLQTFIREVLGSNEVGTQIRRLAALANLFGVSGNITSPLKESLSNVC